MKNNTLYSTALIFLALSSAASAALTAYDGFDYGDTGGDLTGKNGGTGWGGAYTASASVNSAIYSTTGLNYTGLATTGGASNTNDGTGSTTISFRDTAATYSSGETWVSFLVQQNGTPDFSLFAGISLYNSVGDAEVAFASHNSEEWRILELNVTGGTTQTGVSIAQDTTYLLVAQIAWGASTTSGNETVSLWVNPTIGGSLGTANAEALDVDMTDFNKIRIAGQDAVDYTFDEIRIGDSFASVTPVPEPSAMLLGSFGLLALFRRRR